MTPSDQDEETETPEGTSRGPRNQESSDDESCIGPSCDAEKEKRKDTLNGIGQVGRFGDEDGGEPATTGAGLKPAKKQEHKLVTPSDQVNDTVRKERILRHRAARYDKIDGDSNYEQILRPVATNVERWSLLHSRYRKKRARNASSEIEPSAVGIKSINIYRVFVFIPGASSVRFFCLLTSHNEILLKFINTTNPSMTFNREDTPYVKEHFKAVASILSVTTRTIADYRMWRR